VRDPKILDSHFEEEDPESFDSGFEQRGRAQTHALLGALLVAVDASNVLKTQSALWWVGAMAGIRTMTTTDATS
jgi:hypothetical protein